MTRAGLTLTLFALAACRASGESDPDAAAVIDAAAQADASAVDAADPADAAGTPDARLDAAIAEGAVINEALLDDNVGGSDITEFVEVFGDPSTDYSALTILQIDGDVGGDGPGFVLTVHAVGTTDVSGFWDTDVLPANTMQNGTGTLLLVQDFTGTATDDLDTDDDGTFDTMPWAAVLDAVAFDDEMGTNVTYAGAAVLGMPFGGAARIPDGADSDGTTEWVQHQTGTETMSGRANPTRGGPNMVQP